jgi:hypothetical protein
VASRRQRHAVRGKKQKSAASHEGDPRTDSASNRPTSVAREASNPPHEQFRSTVDAAKKLLLCNIQEVAHRLAGSSIILLPRLFPDGSQQCIRDAFAQFLRIGKKFPNEIRMDPAKWARSMAAWVITENVKNGPFEVCLQQLLSLLEGEEAKAILVEQAILEEAGHEGRTGVTESPPADADAVIGGDGMAQVVAKNAVRLTSTVNKTEPANTDSAESKSLDPSEGTRADLEVAKDSTGIIGSKTKRGPEAKMTFHRAVAEVVHSFGPNWKEHLDQIAGKLDKRKRDLPPPAIWATRNPPARSWKRAVEQYPDIVLKTLAYSLKMTARDTLGKPSQTLVNSR